MIRIVLLLMAMAPLLGCGRPSAPVSSPPLVSSSEQVHSATKTVAVAAASDLKFALDEVIGHFQRAHPEIHVEATYGASGNLYSQLINHAPFDLFLSADIGLPRKLIESDLAIKESEFQYAVGHIGLWVRLESPLNLDQGISVLTDSAVQKIAIANPKHAPYGRAAEAALKHFQIDESVKDRLVLGENIAQATQFVESGAAGIGFVAQSLAMAPTLRDKGRFWLLPPESYPRLEQGGVFMAWAKDRAACEKLKSFLMSEAGRAILERYGFDAAAQ